jgi:hypothetical protein
MAIRTNTNPRRLDLQPELRDILMRNGMQAHIVPEGDSFHLVVQGHDSPLLRYQLNRQQLLALTDWGTNSANKKAYNTFTDIISADFDMPRDFVHARNANGRVAMGLHGYRIGIGEYGRVGRYGMPPPFLGWTPRQQGGFHLRRIGGQLFYSGAPMVAERPDGRLKPGELQSGGYGFYYKGQQRTTVDSQNFPHDVLQDLETVITPMVNKPRSDEPALPYNELISSPVYFSNDKWLECLNSHGVIVDTENKTLTIQSEKVNADMVYDLTDEELSAITSNSIEDYPIEERLEILNNLVKNDFTGVVTLDTLNKTERISIPLHPEVEQDLALRQHQEQEILMPLEMGESTDIAPHSAEQVIILADEESIQGPQNILTIDGRDLPSLNESKGWYSEDKQGEEVEVCSISVHPSETEGKYKMTAVINGEAITHEISQKQYDKFLAVDDYHRMKLFSRIFDEVDMKTRPEMQRDLGTKIFAALAAGSVVLSEVVHDMHHPRPEFYEEHMCNAPRPYFKPGVDTPRDVAARYFEAQMNQEIAEIRRGF